MATRDDGDREAPEESMKYRVTYTYTATVDVDVEADSEDAAFEQGLADAEFHINGALHLADWEVVKVDEDDEHTH